MKSAPTLRLNASEKNAHIDFYSSTPDQTQAIGGIVVSALYKFLMHKPIIIALSGDLGSGKTEFSKGVAKALFIDRSITSPTFTLSHEYPFSMDEKKGIFFHIDAWRLENEDELFRIGLTNAITQNSIVCLEWADKTKKSLDQIKADVIFIQVAIEYTPLESRHIIVTGPFESVSV